MSKLRALRAGRLRTTAVLGGLSGRGLAEIRNALIEINDNPRARLHDALRGKFAAQKGATSAARHPWSDLVDTRALPMHAEAPLLARAGRDRFGRRHWLLPCALRAFERMRSAANADGIALELVSSFRSVSDQVRILERKHRAGKSWAEILEVNAPPGYSEHHSGRAVDLAAPGEPILTQAFELTSAFTWLCANAASFGYRLSYPRGNVYGYIYEPWHWYYESLS